jgi:hypothetical protein
LEKYDENTCLMMFKKYFIDNFIEDELIDKCFNAEINSIYIRPTIWKLLLGAIPNTKNPYDWIHSVSSTRETVKKRLLQSDRKKLNGDPLGDNTNEVR